jgi:hypothetical protein
MKRGKHSLADDFDVAAIGDPVQQIQGQLLVCFVLGL